MTRTPHDVKRAIHDLVVDAAPDELVDVGYSLQEVRTVVRKELDRVKALLRARVGPRGGILDGMGASASISAQETVLRTIQNPDVGALQRVLGSRFHEFFRVETVLVPIDEGLGKIRELPPATRELVFANIEQDVGGGGVTFNPRRRP